tara:strand:- start:98447 stop:99121 length:675 start_codon:yes stop_codon:yes gene_type:complete
LGVTRQSAAPKKASGKKTRRGSDAASHAPVLKGQPGDKASLILEAALDLFRQYGYRRTSMEDIATAAQVAKGTLYLYFKSKDELFEALARHLAAQIEQDLIQALALDVDLESKLLAVLDAKLGFVYRWVLSSPHAAELTDPTSRLPDDVFGPVDQMLRRKLSDLFKEAAKRGELDLAAAGLTPELAVDTLLVAAHGAEFGAASESEFHDRLARIARLTLRGLRA